MVRPMVELHEANFKRHWRPYVVKPVPKTRLPFVLGDIVQDPSEDRCSPWDCPIVTLLGCVCG